MPGYPSSVISLLLVQLESVRTPLRPYLSAPEILLGPEHPLVPAPSTLSPGMPNSHPTCPRPQEVLPTGVLRWSP